jgi:hypothetical protein
MARWTALATNSRDAVDVAESPDVGVGVGVGAVVNTSDLRFLDAEVADDGDMSLEEAAVLGELGFGFGLAFLAAFAASRRVLARSFRLSTTCGAG